MAEGGAVKRLPVAAMDEDNDRRMIGSSKQVDPVALAWAVTQHTRRILQAVVGGVLDPRRHQRGMLRHPRAVVVFRLVVDGAHRSSPARRRADFCTDSLVLASRRISSRTSFGVRSPNMSDIQV